VHYENLGSDNYIFVDIGSTEPVIVREDGTASYEIGAKVGIRPQAHNLHRFDANGKPIR
jgi:multiple sugar transport system ATP-binding protein